MSRAIPKQTAVWDERRNSSQVLAVPPDALPNALKALARYREQFPLHRRWILDGAPTLTEAEHVERFRIAYKRGTLT